MFVLAIAHSDDVGLLTYNFRSLKGTLEPLKDMDTETFGKKWGNIVDSGLITEFICGKHKYWRLDNFFKNQRLRRDLQPFTILKDFVKEKTPAASWRKLLKIKGIEEAVTETLRERAADGPVTLRRRTTDGYVPDTELELESYNNKGPGLTSNEVRKGNGLEKRHGKMQSLSENLKSRLKR